MGNVDTAVEIAGKLPGLRLEAERVAEGFMRGMHGRRKAGAGESFWQFRRWQPGDAIAQIDWRRSARSEEVMVRQKEWEAAQAVWLFRESGHSMSFTSSRKYRTKQYYADIMLLALSIVLLNGGERVGLLVANMTLQAGSSAVNAMYDYLPRQSTLDDVAEVKSASHLVLFGDFFTDWDKTRAKLQVLAEKNVKGLLVQVNDKAEETFPYRGRIKFREYLDNAEGEIFAPKAEDMAEEYRTRFNDYRTALASFAQSIGWNFMSCTTDKRLEETLLRIYELMAVKK